jgi:hypothetical protein
MKRIVFAFAVAAMTLGMIPASQAAPVAPLPSAIAAGNGNLVHVQWWWHRRRWGHRRCWVGRYGRVHCRYW